MIDRANVLPLTRQASLLRLSRSRVYYLPRPVPLARLAIMHRIDALHLDFPFAGSRTLRDLLRAEGVVIGRLAVATLMRRMGIEALYRRPNTSKPAPGHKIYPYLLRNLVVDRPNQVWAMDITYIPMARGFVYLAAVVDWFSRRVLAWRLSITLETEFCLDAVTEALARHGKPGTFNTAGQPIHPRGLHGAAARAGYRHQHGRAWCLAGQCVCRAAVAFGEVRGGVSAGLRQRERCARVARPVSGFRQWPATAFEPWGEDAGAGLSRPSSAADSSVRGPSVSWCSSGSAKPALRNTTTPARRAHQPAGKPLIKTETL